MVCVHRSVLWFRWGGKEGTEKRKAENRESGKQGRERRNRKAKSEKRESGKRKRRKHKNGNGKWRLYPFPLFRFSLFQFRFLAFPIFAFPHPLFQCDCHHIFAEQIWSRRVSCRQTYSWDLSGPASAGRKVGLGRKAGPRFWRPRRSLRFGPWNQTSSDSMRRILNPAISSPTW